MESGELVVSCIVISILVLILFFYGDPDIHDAIIKYLTFFG